MISTRHIVIRWVFLLLTLCCVSVAFAQNNKGKKEESNENINKWLNSPQLKEMASRPELQALISLYAKQIFVVNGKVFGTDDFEPKPYPLQGANIEVRCVGDSTEMYGAASNANGEFLVPIFMRHRPKSTDLHIKISYIGMDGVNRVFKPKEVKLLGQKVLQVEFDSLVLHSDPMTLAEAEVIGELQKMYQNGDTVIFNAEAYEMPSGSVLLDLVRRLPGLQLIGGKLTYMNRDIEEIRLNGDNFFKRDMSIALQNMPHDKMKSLKVYEVPDDTLDVMSEKHLVMDVKSKDPMDKVIFGNASVGATSDLDLWEVGADFSQWKKEGGQIHASFNTTDIPGPGSMTEDEKRTNAAASYEQQLGNTKVEGGLKHDYNRSESRRSSYNKVFLPDYTQNSVSESRNGSKSKSYSGNIRLDGHWGENTYWNTRADISKTETFGWNTSSDSISNDLNAISTTRTSNRSESTSKNVNWRGGVRRYFGTERQTEVGINASFGYTDGESTNTNYTSSRFYQFGDSLRIVNHIIDNPSERTNWGASAHYRHRFGEFTNLRINYEFNYSKNTNSQSYNDVVGNSLMAIDSLHFDNKYKDVSHGPSMDFKFDNEKIMFQFLGKAQPTVRTADNTQFTRFNHSSYRSVQYLANAKLEVKMHEAKNKLTLSYNGSNSLPSPNDISSVIDYSNPMNIRMGNPHLKEAFRHQVGGEYQLGALMRFSTNFNWTDNQQTPLSVIDRQSGIRTSTPTNINGNWGSNSYLFVTKPVGDVTIAALANYNYNHSVSFVQDFGNIAPVKSASNWQRLDGSVYATYSNKSLVTILRANYSMDHNKSDYLTTSTKGQQAGGSLNLEYTLPLKLNIKVKSDLNYNRKFGFELASANRPEYVWNASAEYKFLGIITASLEWRDILDSQQGFNASMSGTGWSESQQYGNTSMVLFRLAVKMNGFNGGRHPRLPM